jgi:hypothetical protein
LIKDWWKTQCSPSGSAGSINLIIAYVLAILKTTFSLGILMLPKEAKLLSAELIQTGILVKLAGLQ